ncbi:hypothetical protein BJ912DRAFT_5025 [Pholiota molesta]|nr:hypothetical protein BJ912DRAFT_5025 [Pholiota molesta]
MGGRSRSDYEGCGRVVEEEGGERNRKAGVEIRPRQAHVREDSGGVSASLPVDSGMAALSTRPRQPLRRPSLDLRESPTSADSPNSNWPSDGTPRLVYSHQHRANLIAPPPRAITQYAASTQGADASYFLPPLACAPHPHTPAPASDGRSLIISPRPRLQVCFLIHHPCLHSSRTVRPSPHACIQHARIICCPPALLVPVTPSTSFTQSFMRRRGSASTTASNSSERGTERGGARRPRLRPPSHPHSGARAARRRARPTCGR